MMTQWFKRQKLKQKIRNKPGHSEGQGCSILSAEYPLLWCSRMRTQVILFCLVLGIAMFGSFAPDLGLWLASAAVSTTEHRLAVAVFVAFTLSMLTFTLYNYYAVNIILGWTEGFGRLCRQSAASDPHQLEVMTARCVRAYSRLDICFGRIALFATAFCQLLCILEMYRAIGSLVVTQLEAFIVIDQHCGQFIHYWDVGAAVCLATSMAAFNMMLTDASLEAQAALKNLLEPLEMARLRLEAEEAVSTTESSNYLLTQTH